MRKTKTVLSVFLCFCIFAVGLYLGNSPLFASAETVYTGTVVGIDAGSSLNVRSGPGTNYGTIGSLNNGATVTIHGSAVGGASGGQWYQIDYGGTTGYVSATYVGNVKEAPTYTPDADFEQYLSAQGFPESYKPYLRTLHAAHPSWVFMADTLSMTWQAALSAESKVGVNTVAGSSKDSWKSMEEGAYNWSDNSYKSFDSGGWVAAYTDVIAYYMEPRNFMTDSSIYLFLDHSYNSTYQTVDGLNRMLQGTFMAGSFPEDTYDTYADVLMEAGRQSGVNPYILAAMIIVEQGAQGTGRSISGTEPGYEGYYNYFNIGAFAADGLTAVQRGLRTARDSMGNYGGPWNTRAKSIIGGAKYYGSNYVAKGQNTLYYKKYNVTVTPYYGHQYMTNVAGAATEASRLRNAYAGISVDEMPLVFRIPVYRDMPSTNATQLPTSTGANNYFLSDLSINGYSIMPTYTRYTRSYEATVDNSAASVYINATPEPGASVTGNGWRDLNVGTNTIVLTVTAASGKTSTYTLNITRQEGQSDSQPPTPPTPTDPDPTITGAYTVGAYLTGVAPGTSVSTFMEKLGVQNGTAKVFAANGGQKTSGNIATGDAVALYSGSTEKLRKTIVVYGDTDGNGEINIVDLANIQKHLLNIKTLSGVYATAADVHRDGSLNIVDLADLQKHLLRLITIKQ